MEFLNLFPLTIYKSALGLDEIVRKNLNSHQPLLEVLKTDLSKEFNTLKSNGDLQRGH